MTDEPRFKTMLNIPSPASGPPRVVGPPELVIAENDALRAEIERLRAAIPTFTEGTSIATVNERLDVLRAAFDARGRS